MKHLDKLLIGHLNINSLRNKFCQVPVIFKECLDIFLISETKLDHTFTTAQFVLDGYHAPLRQDRDKYGGGLMFFVRKNLLSSQLTMSNHPDNFEAIFLELNLRSQKWLIIGTYKPPKQPSSEFLTHLETAIQQFNYENIIILGDFNINAGDKCLDDLHIKYNLEMIVKDPTCFKSAENPSTIDHIWVSDKRSFSKTVTVETGLSDHHKLVVSVLNRKPPKNKPRVIHYRTYHKFDSESFQLELIETVKSIQESQCFDYSIFEEKFRSLVDKYLPMKKKFIRSNEAPFLNKRLRKEIMIRSRKRNIYNKDPTAYHWNQYRIQRNKCLSLIRKAKKDYYHSLSMKTLSNQRKFWKTVRPIFSEKAYAEKISSIINDGDIITDNEEIANIMNKFYTNITKSLDIHDIPVAENEEHIMFDNAIDKIIHKFHSHPSVSRIKDTYPTDTLFNFREVGEEQTRKYIDKLDPKKSTPQGDIPAKILKQFADHYCELLTRTYNNGRVNRVFPDGMKEADVSPMFKKGLKSEKSNYRPVSKLQSLSKIFERIMYDDIADFMSSRLSPLLSGFRSKYSSQHALLSMIDKWHRELDRGNIVSAVLMDLSKAFDCINHELLIAKLHAYGFSRDSLEFIFSYLTDRSQRVVVEGETSSWRDIEIGVPQGSILGPLLFNIYINDIFLFIEDPNVFICNYADDNTLYSADKDPSTMMKRVEENMTVISQWYRDNGLQLNGDKCKLIVFKGMKKFDFDFEVRIGHEVVREVSKVKLLGIEIDNMLSYREHVNALCRKVNAKISALKRISPLLSLEQHRAIVNSFVSSELNYCPLVWSFASRGNLTRVQNLQDRVERLRPDCSHLCIHRRNCETLLREVFKTKHSLNPSYMKEVFNFKENVPYNTRAPSRFVQRPVKTTRHGLQTVSYIGAHLWDSLPASVQEVETLSVFSSKLRGIEDLNCRCCLCAERIAGLGFI